MSHSSFIAGLRWLTVLPASILSTMALGSLAGAVRPRRLAQLSGTPVAPPTIVERLFPLILLSAMGLAFVIVGAKLAPRRRPQTALVLSGLWTLSAFLMHVFVHFGRGQPHWLAFLVAVVAALAGVRFIRRWERGSLDA